MKFGRVVGSGHKVFLRLLYVVFFCRVVCRGTFLRFRLVCFERREKKKISLKGFVFFFKSVLYTGNLKIGAP